MKKIFTTLTLAAVLLCTGSAFAAPNPKVRGTVKDNNGEAVGFCNVMFAPVTDTLNIKGDITNAEGYFDMPVPAGEYQLTITMMGYETIRKTVVLHEDTDLGTIIMPESSIRMEAAVITSDMVRRKADGYMFLPAGSPITTGRNSLELLTYAPGVWIDKDRGITINGKTGTKVMVNDRILTMTGEELTAYLESIDAEQIRSIEVIPDAGAQYDADSAGGILKITLKRAMNGGLSGSLGTSLAFHDDLFPGRVRPTANLEYRKDRLSLYTNFYYQHGQDKERDRERTLYESEDNREIDGIMHYDGLSNSYSGRIGAVYELTDRQSVGLDFDLYSYHNNQDGLALGEIRATGYHAESESNYFSRENRDRYNFSFNYKLKTDDKGSNLMIVADYMRNKNSRFENNHNTEDPLTRALIENNRNSNRLSNADSYTVRADYKHYLNQKIQLEAGMKYAYTDMDTDIRYEDLIGGSWVPDQASNDHYLYREGVLAGYVNGTANLGRVNLSAGLRVENTDLRPHSFINPEDSKKQNYTDFFPTARAIYFINQEKGHLINASYTRRISRPGFNQLNPFRMQINNYTYIIGNPDMKPSYTDNYSLTGVVANKYNLTLGFQNIKGAVRQIVILDPEDPDILLYQHHNLDRIQSLYVSLTIPVQIRPWWRMSLDGTLMRNFNKIGDYDLNGNTFQGRVNNLFTFPKSWSAEVNYHYISGFIQGNMKAGSWDFLNLSVKKSFFNDRLTASVSVDNVLFDGGYMMSATVSEPGKFTKHLDMKNSNNPTRRYSFSLRWNFRAGRDMKKVQKVVFGNEEERER